MRSWVACLVCFLLAATTGAKDTWQNSSEKLKRWRHLKKLAEYDRPAIATLQASALGNRQEHQSDIVPVPTHLTHAYSDADTTGQHGIDHPAIVTWQNSSEKLKHWRHVKKLAEYDRPAIATLQASALGNRQEHQSDIVPVPTHLTHADSDADTAGQHGIDHPAIVIDLPVIECECKYSYGSDATTLARREQGGDASSMESIACNAESRVYLIFLVHGLVPGFVYEVQFECEWSGEDEYHWKTEFTPSTRSYTVKLSLERSQKTRALNSHTSMWDTYIPQEDAFFVEVTVRDMLPGLTSEEALIGTRRLNSVVNTARLRCADLESGERTNMPDGGEDEWKFNFSAAVEDVRVSYSETVVALAMLNRYGLDEWARISQNMSDDNHTVTDLHIPAVVFNHKQDGRRVFVEGMLRAVGFRDITFQPTYEIAKIDLAALENSGRVSANWDYVVKETMGWKDVSDVRKMRYIAHALDFQDVIERHISSAADFAGVSSWIAVFEDDIVLTTSPVNAHKRLVEALSSLPHNAHVLYVEWCFDLCGESRLNTQYPLVSLASRPHCSAGILFSAQGARKLKTLLRPIDSTIDDMFASLCHRRAIYCYKLRLPIFTHDKKWGSNFDEERQKWASHFHDFNSILCHEVINVSSDFWSWFHSVRNGYDAPAIVTDVQAVEAPSVNNSKKGSLESVRVKMKDLIEGQTDMQAVEAPSVINIGCETNNFELDSVRVQWIFEHAESQCPQAFFVNCSQLTKEVALQVLQGKHLVFIGDSVTRYQYLNLVQFLTTGHPIWPNLSAPASEYEKQWPSWNAFYQGTNDRLAGQEVCDCFRADDVSLNPNTSFENRYWFGPGKVRVSYIQMLGENDIHGHNVTELGIHCWEKEALSSDRPNFSHCKQTLCSPGECNLQPGFTFDFHSALAVLGNLLQPDVVIVNSYLWSDWNNVVDAQSVANSFRQASNTNIKKNKFVWKTGTPTQTTLSQNRDEIPKIDNILAEVLSKDGHQIFWASRMLYFLPTDAHMYLDEVHFCPSIYHGLNQGLLFQLMDWFKNT